MTDKEALDAIAQLLSGREWEVGDIDRIAAFVRQTGREIRDSEEG